MHEVRVPVATLWSDPEALRPVDARAAQDEPDVVGWAAAMDARLRRGLTGRTLTQLLLGEPVQVVEESGDWVRVAAPLQPSSQDPRGYPGWMRRSHLAAPAWGDSGPLVTAVARDLLCRLEDDSVLELSYGTRLRLEADDGRAATVRLPGDRRGTVSSHALRAVSGGSGTPSGADAVADARRFLGLRYLWGGTSAWGLDCSGLVHLVYRAQGVALARDAQDQASVVEPIPVDAVRPGDLYFFARTDREVNHVGLATGSARDGTRWMLHAPESGELVEHRPLNRSRLRTLVTAGRVTARVPWPAVPDSRALPGSPTVPDGCGTG